MINFNNLKNRFRYWDKKFEKILEVTATITFTLMIFTMIISIFTRFVLAKPIIWSLEFIQFLFIFSIFIGALLVTKRQEHLRINSLVQKLPKKVNIILNLLVNVGILFFIICLFLGIIPLTQRTWQQFSSTTSWLRIRYLYLTLLTVSVFMGIYYFSFIKKIIQKLLLIIRKQGD